MIYVGNLCFFMDAIIKKCLSGVFLVADERAVSTTELIELIAKALGKKVYCSHTLVKTMHFSARL